MTFPKLPILPFAAWPELDRCHWNEALPLLAKLNHKNRLRVGSDYGSFLWFLSREGDLDPSLCPASRVTPDRVPRYVTSLEESGYRTRMIDNKMWALRRAIRAMQPGCDISFVTRLGRKRPTARTRIRRRYPDSGALAKPSPVDLWPETDRTLWEHWLQPHSLLDRPYGRPLRPDTIQQLIEDYSFWLKFLRSRGWLDCALKPSGRVRRFAVGQYVAWMLETGCSSSTVMGRLYRLRGMVTRMEPDVNLRWLTWPNGRSLWSQLPKSKPRKRPVVDSRVLYDWGSRLILSHEAVGDGPNPGLPFLELRDGLMICLFAARAPRLTSMSRLRLGDNLTRMGNRFRLNLEMDDLKAGDAVEYDLPESLAPALERYLAVRSELPEARSHSFLWVTQQGGILLRGSIEVVVRRRSKQWFGFSFGPHRFRHSLATSAALHDPDHPGVASSIMNNSIPMVEKHYNLSDVLNSANRFHASLQESRRDTRSVAAREFRKQRVKRRRH